MIDGDMPTIGLSRREVERICVAVCRLARPPDRLRTAQFLFELLLHFKTAKSYEAELPRRSLDQFAGAHRNTYLKRLYFAAMAGFIELDDDFENGPRKPGVPRRVRLLVNLDADGEFGRFEQAVLVYPVLAGYPRPSAPVLRLHPLAKPQRSCPRTTGDLEGVSDSRLPARFRTLPRPRVISGIEVEQVRTGGRR